MGTFFASGFNTVSQRIVIQMLGHPLDRDMISFHVRGSAFFLHKARSKVASCMGDLLCWSLSRVSLATRMKTWLWV